MDELKHILLIDDDPFQCELLRVYFEERTSGEIYDAANGQTAVELLENISDEKLDLIVTDLFMPDMDGMEVIEYLSYNQSTTPLLIISGADEAQVHAARVLADAHGLKILGTLHKPLKFGEMDKLLAEYNVGQPPSSH